MTSKTCIIGCGWLGLPLAECLIKKGIEVNGSTTSESKIEKLRTVGINPFLIKLFPNTLYGNIDSCLWDCKSLVLNLPPGLRKNPKQDYAGMLQLLITPILNSSIEHVVFVSSTSVYEDSTKIPIITENSATGNSKTALKLLAAEDLFVKNPGFSSTILRFGGLIGENRHPARNISGKTGIKNPKAPVNLIHQNDCIQIIETILKQDIRGGVFNACSPSHPDREHFYSQSCKTLNLPLPEFDHSRKSTGKIISSEKLAYVLNYGFQYDINN